MRTLTRILRDLPLLILSPVLAVAAIGAIALIDLVYFLRRPRSALENQKPSTETVSVVIPNWNGRGLLETYLPSVVAAVEGHPGSEVIVVDNGSTDGSADYVRRAFPGVRVLALAENLGFGGGSNQGFRVATNDIVVVLNNDMRVAPNFLAPLLEGFTDDTVFAVSCQIFFSHSGKLREETGLTEGWWENGGLRVRHRIDDKVTKLFPCFYGGGGSCAFDRRKFLELGGFDSLFAPFYLEDTDLGFMAWKRGWKVLYEPRSKVYHEHRGTIGKRFTDEQIQAVLKKNYILFCWKNIHEWSRLSSHFWFTCNGAVLSFLFGDSPERATLSAAWKAFFRLPGAVSSRWTARKLAVVDDTEAFRRPLGAYFRDRFHALPAEPATLRVLFVSPYPICPPTHGGGVFMLHTCRELARLCELHLLVMIDHRHEQPPHDELVRECASAEFLLRAQGQRSGFGSILPHAIREFESAELRWLIHRMVFTHEIDVVQLEYLTMGQYRSRFQQLACMLFEHEIYFQSIARGLPQMRGVSKKASAAYEYLRALRYEMQLLPEFDRVQVCSAKNAQYLTSFLPRMQALLDYSSRAGVAVSRYRFQPDGREPDTMLFLGSFRHRPNLEALEWFVDRVLPRVLAKRPEAKLIVVGSDAPAGHLLPELGTAVEFRGSVEDAREPLARYAVFVCPILHGSGIRVKLLEAFATGIPAVSTRLGAEGLAEHDGALCALADDPNAFADKILDLFDNPEKAAQMARRARAEVEANHDIAVLTRRLVENYRDVVAHKRQSS